MKCPKCNSEISNDSVFCEQCGAKVEKKSVFNAKWWVAVALLLFGMFALVVWQVLKSPKPEPALAMEQDTTLEETTVSDNKTDQTFTVGNVTFKMIFVEGGTFQMGSNLGDDDQKPVHSVTVSDFYMGKFEVTQALWQEVMGTTIYQQRDKANTSWSVDGVGADYPMYYVNHTEAEEFCGRLNQRLRSQLLDGYSFALPTEAEWEYAARGGSKSNAYTYSGSNNMSDVGCYFSKVGQSTHTVGSKKANELGLYDMSGNVWEWCSDWYGSYGSSLQTDPRGPSSGLTRVLRAGGSFYDFERYSSVADRSHDDPSSRTTCYGFRLALVRR